MNEKWYASADVGRNSRVLVAEAAQVIVKIECKDEAEMTGMVNRLNVQRHRLKAKNVHLRAVADADVDSAPLFYVEIFNDAVKARREKERDQQKERDNYDRTFSRRINDFKGKKETSAPGEVKDFVMWVGERFYPEIDDFVNEAVEHGVSKRITRIPEGLLLGQSRIFLVHRDGAPSKKERKEGDPTGTIFGFFIVENIDLIVQNKESVKEIRDDLKALNVRLISASAARSEPARGCGHRRLGGLYLVSSPDKDAWTKLVLIAEQMAAKSDVKGGIAVLRKPLPFLGSFFRGIGEFDPTEYGLNFNRNAPLGVERAAARATIVLDPKEDTVKPKAKRGRPRKIAAPVEPEPVETPKKHVHRPEIRKGRLICLVEGCGKDLGSFEDDDFVVVGTDTGRVTTERPVAEAPVVKAPRDPATYKAVREKGKCYGCGVNLGKHYHTGTADRAVVNFCCECAGCVKL